MKHEQIVDSWTLEQKCKVAAMLVGILFTTGMTRPLAQATREVTIDATATKLLAEVTL